MPHRLALDVGTNSIGWWLYRLHDGRIVATEDAGVRVFHDGRDPKSKESLAKDRRIARAARRRRDRYLQRRTSLMRKLAEAGLMPADPDAAKALEARDPFALRARALDERLDLNEIGRALFHLNQRRGFKSNRKTDRGDNEGGKIKDATARLDQTMIAAGARTYGEFLHKRRAANPARPPAVRTRLTTLTLGDDGKTEDGYDFYPDRRHLEAEFDAIWAAQAEHHPDLTDDLRDGLFETIFHQRPLKAPKVGRCQFYEEPRIAKGHPLHQRRVLLETVNALRIRAPGKPERPLTREERDRVLMEIDAKAVKSPTSAKVKFRTLAKRLKLTEHETFSIETDNRDAIECDAVRAILAHKDRYGPGWTTLDTDRQWELIQRVTGVETDEEVDALEAWLMAEHSLTVDAARAVIDAPLPRGYGRLGETATRALIPLLEDEALIYADAATRAFGRHSDIRTDKALDRLPYYGEILDRYVIPGSGEPKDPDVERYGRITNPTVHIGLGQIRKIVNAIIDRHGAPAQIVVELARDLKTSEDEKKKINAAIKKNTDAAKARSALLNGELGQADNGRNRLILRLWEEQGEDPLDRFCPYTGAPITSKMLFDGSVEIDHILPYSQTLDDSVANRVLCLREANREKRNRTPWQVWGGDAERWARIEPLIARLPKNKRWRFAADAMEKYEGESGFLARQLADTQYLSRIAREYLSRLYPNKGEAPVYVIPGRMTEMLRRHWGLNFDLSISENGVSKEKNRADHRHHAIDAAVIGATDRALMQAIQTASGKREDQDLSEVVGDIPAPYDGFRDEVRARLDRIVVSHRADHGRIDPAARKRGQDQTAGQLHNDTAYGLTGEVSGTGAPIVVTRKPFDGLEPKDIPAIRDPDLVAALEQATRGLTGKEFKAALAKFAATDPVYRGIRRVRVEIAQNVIEIADADGRPYKGYKGDSNHCYEVWRMPDGSWERVVVTTFDAHRPGFDSRPHPAAKRLMRLFKRDLIALDHPKTGEPIIAVVAKLGLARLDLAPHNEADADRRARNKDDPFDFIRASLSTLRRCRARPASVDELGRVRDQGPLA